MWPPCLLSLQRILVEGVRDAAFPSVVKRHERGRSTNRPGAGMNGVRGDPPTFRLAVSAEFVLLQGQQRVEDSLVSVHVFHGFARHLYTPTEPSSTLTVPRRRLFLKKKKTFLLHKMKQAAWCSRLLLFPPSRCENAELVG